MTLPGLAVRRPVTIFMFFLAVLLFGFLSLSRMPIDLYPEMEFPNVTVITMYPGASSKDVEKGVSEPIEDAIARLSGLDEVKSVSQNNISVVMASFDWGTDLAEAANDIRDALEFVKKDLPEGIEPPRLMKLSSSMAPVLVTGVSSNENYEGLRYLVETELADPLKRIPGVALISVMGGHTREIQVQVDPQKLEAYGLSLSQLSGILAAENMDLPVGAIEMGWSEYTLRVPGELTDISQLSSVVVGQDQGRLVHLGDIAGVSDGHADVQMEARFDGAPGVVMMIQKQSGANTVEVAEAVKAKIEELKRNLPADVEIIPFMDSSEYIQLAIKSLRTAFLLGFLGVMVVVLFFLRRVRSTIVIGLTIPLSMIVVFIAMYAKGYTINTISLMSLAIALGMVVDSSVVVLENITRHVESGERVREASMYAPSEVGQALTASALTTIAVFIPMMFMTGLVSVMFTQLAFVVTITIAASLLVALTLTPALSSTFLRRALVDSAGASRGWFFTAGERVLSRVDSLYSRLLGRSLKHRRLTLLVAVVVFVVSIALAGSLKTEFFPEEDSGDITLTVEMTPGTSIDRSLEVMNHVAAVVEREIPEQEHYFFRLGLSESGFSAALGEKEGTHIGDFMLKLSPAGERERTSFEIGQVLRNEILAIPSVLRLTVVAGNPMQHAMKGGESPVTVNIMGDDLDEIEEIAERIEEAIREIPGTVDIGIDRGEPQPEFHVIIDREKAASLGVNTAIVAGALREQVHGVKATMFSDRDDEWDVVLRVAEDRRASIDDILDLPIVSVTGHVLTLASVAEVVPGTGPSVINRLDQQRIVKVQAGLHGARLSDVTPRVNAIIASLDIPNDVSVTLGGEAEQQKESFGDLGILFILAIALVYIVMAAQFESFMGPFIVMFSIPFAIVGVIWSFLLTGTTLNMISFLGMIMLMGIVVNNAIVLVDYTNIMRRRGQGIVEALMTAGRRRLRPVLMTALTTVFGMLPLALSRGEGSEMWRPLGVSMVGGLLVATVVTLVLVPTMYLVLMGRRERRQEKRA